MSFGFVDRGVEGCRVNGRRGGGGFHRAVGHCGVIFVLFNLSLKTNKKQRETQQGPLQAAEKLILYMFLDGKFKFNRGLCNEFLPCLYRLVSFGY